MWALGSMIKTLWHTSKTSSDYLAITRRVMFWPMGFIQGCWTFKPSIKDVFHNHWKWLWKIFSSVYILCRNREDLCSCFWIYFFMLKTRGNSLAGSVNTIKLLWDMDPYPKQSFLISFFSLFWCLASNKLHCPSKMLWIFVQKPWRLCNCLWKKMCSWYFFILKIVWLLLKTF